MNSNESKARRNDSSFSWTAPQLRFRESKKLRDFHLPLFPYLDDNHESCIFPLSLTPNLPAQVKTYLDINPKQGSFKRFVYPQARKDKIATQHQPEWTIRRWWIAVTVHQ